MSLRNLSPQYMFEQTAMGHRPQFQVAGGSGEEFASWQQSGLPQVVATLGDFLDRVPLNPQLLAEWQHDGLTTQKWLIDVQEHLSATLLVNLPPGLAV